MNTFYVGGKDIIDETGNNLLIDPEMNEYLSTLSTTNINSPDKIKS